MSFYWEAAHSPSVVIESWGYTRVEQGDPSSSLLVDILASWHTAVIPVYAPPCQRAGIYLKQTQPRGALSVGTTGAEKQTGNRKAVSTFETIRLLVGWIFSYHSDSTNEDNQIFLIGHRTENTILMFLIYRKLA